MSISIVKEVATVSHLIAAFAGGLVHKVYQWIVAEYKKAKAAEAKVVADIKKDV
jgi:hypothetical protein